MPLACLGTGMIVAALKHVGTHDMDSDRLKMVVKTPASSAAQSFSTQPSNPSGPDAFLGLMLLRQSLTS